MKSKKSQIFSHLLANDQKDFLNRTANFVIRKIESDIKKKGLCFLGLSWTKDYYQMIYKRIVKAEGIDWEKVYIFLVHDTYIFQESVHSDQNKIVQMFYKNTSIPKKNIIFPNNSLLPKQ